MTQRTAENLRASPRLAKCLRENNKSQNSGMTMFRRIIWKEYRTQRGLWVGVALMGLAFMVVQWSLIASPGKRELAATALVTSIFYAMGSACVLFAAEKEQDAFRLLQILPLHRRRFMLAKLAWTGGSAVLMFLVLLIAAYAFASRPGHWMEGPGDRDAAEVYLLVFLNSVFIGTLVSLLNRNVLTGVLATAILVLAIHTNPATAIGSLVLCPMLCLLVGHRWFNDSMTSAAREVGIGGVTVSLQSRRQSTSRLDALADRLEPANTWWRAFKRLVWQESRHARIGRLFLLASVLLCCTPAPGSALSVLKGLVAVAGPLLMGVWSFRGEQIDQRYRFLANRGVSRWIVCLSKKTIWLPMALLSVPLACAAVAVSHALGGSAPNFRFVSEISHWVGFSGPNEITPILCLVLMLYFCGQTASVLFSRSITAGFISLVLAAIGCGWVALMHAGRLPLFWTVTPVLLALMLGTFIRLREWMIDRNTVRGWLRVVAGVAVPLLLAVLIVVQYRIGEVASVLNTTQANSRAHGQIQSRVTNQSVTWGPHVLQAESHPSAKTPPDAQGVAAFQRAIKQVEIAKAKLADLQSNGSAASGSGSSIPQTHRSDESQVGESSTAAAQRPDSETVNKQVHLAADSVIEATGREQLTSMSSNIPTTANGSNVIYILLASAQLRIQAKELDKALDCYVAAYQFLNLQATEADNLRWSLAAQELHRLPYSIVEWFADPGQTSERITAALQRLDAESGRFPSPLPPIRRLRNRGHAEVDENSWDDWMAGHMTSFSGSGMHVQTPPRVFFGRALTKLPWEKKRAKTLIDAAAVQAAADIEDVRMRLKWNMNQSGLKQLQTKDSPNAKIEALARTTPAVLQLAPLHAQVRQHGKTLVRIELDRRALLLKGALVAWQLDHDSLPQRLDELVPKYLDRLPLDPWSGAEFGWAPGGYPNAMHYGGGSDPYRDEFERRIIPANVPIFWSSGPSSARIVPVRSRDEHPPSWAAVASGNETQLLPSSVAAFTYGSRTVYNPDSQLARLQRHPPNVSPFRVPLIPSEERRNQNGSPEK